MAADQVVANLSETRTQEVLLNVWRLFSRFLVKADSSRRLRCTTPHTMRESKIGLLLAVENVGKAGWLLLSRWHMLPLMLLLLLLI